MSPVSGRPDPFVALTLVHVQGITGNVEPSASTSFLWPRGSPGAFPPFFEVPSMPSGPAPPGHSARISLAYPKILIRFAFFSHGPSPNDLRPPRFLVPGGSFFVSGFLLALPKLIAKNSIP